MSYGKWVVLAPLILAACSASAAKKETLENVAKDWCLTIRASQVLPVYPLTEDLQPGDVFVVQTPLKRQTKIYAERGFLPLDQHVVRLPNLEEGLRRFYDERGNPMSAGAKMGEGTWSAPRAAFPTYNFEVKRGGGLNLAIPIQGVPVALGLMSTASATGAVSIDDAVTYGIDIETLLTALNTWWQSDPLRRETLAQVASSSSSDVYLRAVNRVYFAHSVTVSLQNLESQGAAAHGGASQPVRLPALSNEEIGEAAEAAASEINTKRPIAAADGLPDAPGGSFRFTQANQSSVTFHEEFDRPLAIGYLGFDVKVNTNGTLSAPIPSFAVLNEDVAWPEYESVEVSLENADSPEEFWALVRQALEEGGADSVEIIPDPEVGFSMNAWYELESE